jgi:hypothetical protein
MAALSFDMSGRSAEVASLTLEAIQNLVREHQSSLGPSTQTPDTRRPPPSVHRLFLAAFPARASQQTGRSRFAWIWRLS